MIIRGLATGILILAALPTTGCGRLFDNVEEKGGLGFSQEEPPKNAGIPAVATATILLDGKDLAILSFSGIESPEVVKSHSASNDVVVHVALRSEKEEYAAVHVRELENISPTNGVYSLDSAIGCRYTMGTSKKKRPYISAVGGSCVNTLTVELPAHDIPRAFYGSRPLFSGEIDLDDLKRVFEARARDPELDSLLRDYVERLPTAAKPLAVADLGELLAPLRDDTTRIDVMTILAPRVSDPANAATLPVGVFTKAEKHARAVKILNAYR